jgi:hypothetical protein
MMTLSARDRVVALDVQLLIDRAGADLTRVREVPQLDEANVVLPTAERARSMSGGERRRFIEEEQLGEAARLHQRAAMPATESQPACDPALPVEPATDAPALVVQTTAVPIDEAACGICDQVAERRDPVLQWHRTIFRCRPGFRYPSPPMIVGELVAAAVVDKRVWDAQGNNASDGVYLVGQPGPALPFVVFRAWKVPTGYVSEEIRFIGPSGRTIYIWGPKATRMIGSMDLTTLVDAVDDAVFDETGTYVASFILDNQIVGEIEFPIYVQLGPAKLPKETEDGLKRSDVIWIGTQTGGKRRTVPAWFAYRNGRIYVLSQKQPGPQEQTVPGVPDAQELVVITRRKLRDTALQEFTVAQRVLEGQEWEEAAKILVDRRRSRVGPPADSLNRWRGACHIVELTPNVPA